MENKHLKKLKLKKVGERFMEKFECKSNVVERLEMELNSFNWIALNDFKEEVIKRDKPLVERIEANGKELLVTFFYEDEESMDNVSVYARYAGWGGSEKELKRLGDTNIWYRTFRIRNLYSDISNLSRNYVIKIIQYKVKYKYNVA